MSEPEKNGLLDLVAEHDAAVARIGELVLERDRLQEEVTRLLLNRDDERLRADLNFASYERVKERASMLRDALKLFVDFGWHRLTLYSKDYLEGRFSAEIMDRALAALRGGTDG